MKTNCWLILGTMLATTAVAQVNTNKLPEIPAPATVAPAPAAPAPAVTPAEIQTNAPVKKKVVKAKKKAVKKKVAVKDAEKAAAKNASEAPAGPVILVPGPATVAADNVNLRGQAGLQGEVVGHVKKGETVTVIAEINLDKPKAGEPAQWAKIALPSGTKVWIDSKYVDKTNNVVSAKKLNLRGGPGENYSVLGVIEKGAAVTSVSTKGDWIQIETPSSAFAFAAAHYLKQEAGMETNMAAQPTLANTETVPAPAMNAAPEPAPAPVAPPPAPMPTTVAEEPVIAPPASTPPPAPMTPAAPAPAPAPVAPPPAPETTATAPATISMAQAPTPDMTPTPTLAPEEDTDLDTNLPPRIVTHEGLVRHSVSPVAPTYFELYDPSDDKAIDYLYSPSTNLNLRVYDGRHIEVTGQEAMDVRWKDTPVITIQKIYVLPPEKPVLKPVKKSNSK